MGEWRADWLIYQPIKSPLFRCSYSRTGYDSDNSDKAQKLGTEHML